MTSALPPLKRFKFSARYIYRTGGYELASGRHQAHYQVMFGIWTKAARDYACSQSMCLGTKDIPKGAWLLRIEVPGTGFTLPGRTHVYHKRVVCETCARAMNHMHPPGRG